MRREGVHIHNKHVSLNQSVFAFCGAMSGASARYAGSSGFELFPRDRVYALGLFMVFSVPANTFCDGSLD